MTSSEELSPLVELIVDLRERLNELQAHVVQLERALVRETNRAITAERTLRHLQDKKGEDR